MQQQLSSRHLFIGGLERVWTISVASSVLGLGGLLISSSLGVFGVWAPLGADAEGPLSLSPQLIVSSSYDVGADAGGDPLRTTAGGPGIGEL